MDFNENIPIYLKLLWGHTLHINFSLKNKPIKGRKWTTEPTQNFITTKCS